MIGAILNIAAGTFGKWLDTKAEASRTEARARAEQRASGIAGWSDEWLVIVLTLPLMFLFIPATQPTILAGFDSLKTLPDWYIGLILSVVASVFGFDKLFKWKR